MEGAYTVFTYSTILDLSRREFFMRNKKNNKVDWRNLPLATVLTPPQS